MQTIFCLLAASLSLSAAEVPPHIARGHLLAAYCTARFDEKLDHVTAIYREIIPVAAPPGSYTTVAFNGGYVGLAGNKDATGGSTINFSIWGEDAVEAQPADKKYGTIRTRQFTHEGTGWAGRLAYSWKVGTRYQVYVHVRHENGTTIFSAWFGSVEKHEWLLAGRIRKSGTHYLGHAGGFLEHAGTKDMQISRSTGYGPAWVHNGQRWHACTRAEASVKDPENACFFQRDGVVYLEIGLGLKSDQGKKHTYPLKASAPEPPALPEEVAKSSADACARPHPPYVAWFQPKFYAQDPDLYRHLTLDAGGTVPPEQLQQHGALGLAWAYGINNPDAKGPDYWRDICSPEYRHWAGLGKKPRQVTTQLIRPGVALDEWCNPTHPKSEQWAAEGLRQGRKQWPDCFIAVWVTDLTEPLAALVRDGTVDLLILECYAHAPANLGPGPFAQSLPGVYHRVGLVKKAGLLDKAIICLGHITDEPDLKGRRLTPDGLRTLAEDLRTRFPECPGIAFYQAHERKTARELIQTCDEIGAGFMAKPKP